MIDSELLLDVLHELGFEGVFAEDETEICIACPLCADDNKRLYIESENGVWLCFKCDERGDLFALFNRAIGLSARESFEKMREVRFQYGSRYHFADLEEEKPEPAKVELPEEFIPFWDGNRTSPYSEYLQGRGVHHDMRTAYRMGYCDKGPYAGRVIIPVYGAPAVTLYTFVARTIDPDEPKKVLYPPHSRPSGTLFNLAELQAGPIPRGPSQLVLVEGVFDALALPGNAAAILGSSLSPDQLDLLHKLGSEWFPIIVCMDGDDAGRRASKTIMRQLWGNMLKAEEAILPPDEDPASAPWPVLKEALGWGA